jgi:hypothetical protein
MVVDFKSNEIPEIQKKIESYKYMRYKAITKLEKKILK